MKDEYDVIVIGAGPAGGQCARNIAKQGISVLLVERFNSFYDNNYSSAGMSMQGFQEFDLPKSVIGSYWKKLSIQSSNEFARWESEDNKGVVLDFAKLKQFLSEDCKKEGGDVLMGYTYTSKKIEKDGKISAQFYSKKEDKEFNATAKLLVDATGPARKVMYNNKEEQPKMEEGVGVEYMIKVSDIVYNKYKEDLFFFLGQKWCGNGYSWIFPMEKNILKVGTGVLLPRKENDTSSLKEITEGIIANYMEAKDYEVIDIHGGKVRGSKNINDIFYKENVVAIGDAISGINPLGGEGIRYALRSANDVTPHIENFVVNGKNSFSTYRKKWRKRHLFIWRVCFFLADMIYNRFSDKMIDNKIKKYKNLVTIDQMIDKLFEFKFDKLFYRLLSYSWNKVKLKFKPAIN